MDVVHRPGRLHGNADGLSRIPWVEDDTAETRLSESEEETTRVYLTQESLLSRSEIQLELKQDPVLSRVANWLKAGDRPPRKDVEGGGRELLSYWSEWSRWSSKMI